MRFRPCIDIHNGKVKQIVGSSLKDQGDFVAENFVSEKDAAWYADRYQKDGLRGGHVILLNAQDSPYYPETKKQALNALSQTPGLLQVGGGINAENASAFLEAGASHVIVTSYVFREGRICWENLEKLCRETGKEHLVLDLSCKRCDDGYHIVTDRWQKLTQVLLGEETVKEMAGFCDEFLIHAADAEGKQAGPEEKVVSFLGSLKEYSFVYAGGIASMDHLELIRREGQGKVDFTIGSALDLFGGSVPYRHIIQHFS